MLAIEIYQTKVQGGTCVCCRTYPLFLSDIPACAGDAYVLVYSESTSSVSASMFFQNWARLESILALDGPLASKLMEADCELGLDWLLLFGDSPKSSTLLHLHFCLFLSVTSGRFLLFAFRWYTVMTSGVDLGSLGHVSSLLGIPLDPIGVSCSPARRLALRARVHGPSMVRRHASVGASSCVQAGGHEHLPLFPSPGPVGPTEESKREVHPQGKRDSSERHRRPRIPLREFLLSMG